MAAYHGNTQTELAKLEQIITEFFAKSLHIVLESRCPYVSSRHFSGEQNLSSPSSSSSSSSSVRPRDRWFNLALRDCPAALENIDFWRQSNLEPMVVDVILAQKPVNWDPVNFSPRKGLVRNLSAKERCPCNSELDELGCETKNEKIVERWIVHYETRKSTKESGSANKRFLSCNSSHIVYKKSILLLRSLYLMVRLLPAYKLFRDLNSSGQIGTYNLTHRVSSFVEPFTRKEESDMQRFVFTPVDTSCGRLCISVLYRSKISDPSSETSTPISPQFIPDYVGSPLADPLKRLPSLPAPQCSSPSSSPFGRRHSWSYDQNRASPPLPFPSPSPTYSESNASISKLSSNRLPPMSVPRHLHEASQVHTKRMSFDEYWPSPTFTVSPSPSPPTYIPGSHHMSKALLRTESAPVSIPASKRADTALLLNKQNLPRSPPMKATRAISRIDTKSSVVPTGSSVEKLFSSGKGETGKLSAVKISTNSSPQTPRISYSRSSSRLSFEDTFDDSEFSGPFVLDDDDMMDPRSRPGSFDQTSQVGALLCMLKKAPPLCQDLSESRNLSKSGTVSVQNQEPAQISGKPPEFQQKVSSSMTSSGVFSSKTTADALEELRAYKDMKDLLMRQGGKSET